MRFKEETQESETSESSKSISSSRIGESLRSSPSADNLAYFYQAADGQQVYLSPINFRMLLDQYGQLRFSPPEITATIIDLETLTVTEENRKRLVNSF